MENTLNFRILKSAHPSEYNSNVFKTYEIYTKRCHRETLSSRLTENNHFCINYQTKPITSVSFYTDSSYELVNKKALETKIVKFNSNFYDKNLSSYGFTPSIIKIQNNNAKKLFEHLKNGKKSISLLTQIEGEKMLLNNGSKKFKKNILIKLSKKNPRNFNNIHKESFQTSMRNIKNSLNIGKKDNQKNSYNIKYKGQDNFIYNVCIGLKRKAKIGKDKNKYPHNLKINYLREPFLNFSFFPKKLSISNKIKGQKIPLQMSKIFYAEDPLIDLQSRAQTKCEKDKSECFQNDFINNSKELSLVEVLPQRKLCEFNHIKKVFKNKFKNIEIKPQKNK